MTESKYFVGRRKSDYRYKVYRIAPYNMDYEKIWSGDDYGDAIFFQIDANAKLRQAERELMGGKPTRLDKIREIEQAKLKAWKEACNG